MDSSFYDVTGTITRYYRVDRRYICFIHFTIEACDGIASVSTVDRIQGIIKIVIPVSQTEEADLVLGVLAQETGMEELLPERVGNEGHL
jgi:Domain of unknown function (DUF4911)